MDFFNDIFHNLALLEFYFLNIIYILLYIESILSIFFQHSNILTRASHHWCLASNIVLVSPRCPDDHKRLPWLQGSWGQHGVHLRPTGPRWAPCWPHELCSLGKIFMLALDLNDVQGIDIKSHKVQIQGMSLIDKKTCSLTIFLKLFC